jgi:hypothetical protein
MTTKPQFLVCITKTNTRKSTFVCVSAQTHTQEKPIFYVCYLNQSNSTPLKSE